MRVDCTSLLRLMPSTNSEAFRNASSSFLAQVLIDRADHYAVLGELFGNTRRIGVCWAALPSFPCAHVRC